MDAHVLPKGESLGLICTCFPLKSSTTSSGLYCVFHHVLIEYFLFHPFCRYFIVLVERKFNRV